MQRLRPGPSKTLSNNLTSRQGWSWRGQYFAQKNVSTWPQVKLHFANSRNLQIPPVDLIFCEADSKTFWVCGCFKPCAAARSQGG